MPEDSQYIYDELKLAVVCRVSLSRRCPMVSLRFFVLDNRMVMYAWIQPLNAGMAVHGDFFTARSPLIAAVLEGGTNMRASVIAGDTLQICPYMLLTHQLLSELSCGYTCSCQMLRCLRILRFYSFLWSMTGAPSLILSLTFPPYNERCS